MDLGNLALSDLFFKADGSFWFFMFFIIIVFLSALLNFILCLCKNEYTLVKRVWLILFNIGLNAVFLAICLALSFGVELFLLFLGVSLILICLTFCFSVKRKVKKEQLINLARLIDKKAQEQQGENKQLIKERNVVAEENFSVSEKEEKTKETNCDLDFEHVKNVISRLEYYSLSQADRRQVSELEGYIRSAENNGMNDHFKTKINDGLGALLKLMSKYGF